ncbi:hypothetical protein MTO96_021192 [Rhipicephalus appendiculatus]
MSQFGRGPPALVSTTRSTVFPFVSTTSSSPFSLPNETLRPHDLIRGLGAAAFIRGYSFILIGEEPECRSISEKSSSHSDKKEQGRQQLARMNGARYRCASYTAAASRKPRLACRA